MTFQVGDVVRCIEGKNKYRSDIPIIKAGEVYTILDVTHDGSDTFVKVDAPTARNLNFFSNRFVLATGQSTNPIIRKIKLMEQRFKTNQENKRDYNLAA